jgi:hypothetical protein
MKDESIFENLKKQINVDKEVVTVSPKNGIKQIKKTKEKIEKLKEEYSELRMELQKEIDIRYKKYINVTENTKINELLEDEKVINNNIRIINNRTSYEKMNLDRIMYDINGYYKKSLETINKEIIEGIKNFEDIGIILNVDDFDISEYTNDYMNVLISEKDESNLNSDRINDIFEKVYWKCSELMSHIYVNLRYIYDKNEKTIEQYYQKKINKITDTENINEENLQEKKRKNIRERICLENIDSKRLLDNFIDGTRNINDYKTDNYKKIYEELITRDISTLSQEEKEEYDENIHKLYFNLIEYSNYLKVKFLIDEIIKIRDEIKKEEEEKNKKDKKNTKQNILMDLRKKIEQNLEEIKKYNKKINKEGLFDKKLTESEVSTLRLNRNNKILETKNLYIEYDNEQIKNEIKNKICDTSSILDVLKLATYNYGFMAKCLIRKEPEILDDEIIQRIKEIRKLIESSEFSVINNVCISENKTLDIIIKDRYKFSRININKESFSEDNLEDIIKRTKIIDGYNNIRKSQYTVEVLEFIVAVEQMKNK